MDATRAEAVSAIQPAKSDRNILLAAKGGGIAFAGNLFVYVFRFLFGLVLARMLGAELLGLYSLSSTVTSLVAVLSVLGISAGVVRFIPIARNQKDDARLWGIILTGLALPALISTVLVIGVMLLAEPIAIGIFDRPDLVPVLRLDSLGVPFVVLLSVLSSITQGFKRMEYKVVSEDVTWNVVKLILSVVLLVAGLGVMGAVLANNIAAAAAVAVSLFFLHRLFPLNRPLKAARPNVREMLDFSLPIYLTRVLSRFSGSIEALVLGFLGLVSGVGIYTTALRLSGVGRLFHQSLQQIAMPMISDLHDRGALDELARLYRATTKWGMTFNLPVFLTMALFAGPLLSIFGAEFVEGATGLIILAFATLFNASTGVCGSVITMTGHSRMTFFNSVFNLGVNLVLDLLLIPRFGIIGAALAVTLSEVTLNVIRTVQVYVLLRIWPFDWSFLKPIAASLLAAGAAYLLVEGMGFLPVVLQVILGGLLLWGVFALAIVLLKLSDDDRLVLGRLWDRLQFLSGHRQGMVFAMPMRISRFLLKAKSAVLRIARDRIGSGILDWSFLTRGTVLLLAPVTGILLAVLIATDQWIFALGLVLAVPLLVLFLSYPFAGLVVWMVANAFLQVPPIRAFRMAFWLVHRGLPPALLVVIVLATLVGMPRGRWRVRLGRAEFATMVFLGLGALNILWLQSDPLPYFYLLYDQVFVPFCLYLLIRWLSPSEQDLRWLVPVALFMVIVQSALGFLSWFAPGLLPPVWIYNEGSRTTGSLGFPHAYTTTLVFFGVLLVHAAANSRSKFVRLAYLSAFAFGSIGIFLSFSRGSWLGAVAAMVGLLFVYPKVLARLAFVVVIVFLVLGSGLLSEQIDFASRRMGSEDTAKDRLVIWDAGLQMIGLKPLFGWGFDDYGLYAWQYQRRVQNYVNFDPHASHNSYITIAAEMGIPALLLFMFPVVWWFWRTLKAWPLMPRRGIFSRALLAVLWLVIIDHVVVNFFSDMLHSTYGMGMWWITLGLIAHTVELYLNPDAQERSPSSQEVGRTIGTRQ